uniref:Zinc finger protein 385A n=1 Tax=Tetraodon nigroviridis TaxID=99883 RepID=H3DC89_TETNG
AGGINRAGAAVPTFLRTPTMIQPHLDMKSFLQFPMETPPPPHSMSLFHNFNTMDPVQKAVINHTFGMPLIKTKRPVISCNVCQIRFNSESQAEAHYKGNRHARRVKGIETSKSRPQDGDKPPAVPPTTSPSPIGAPGTNPDSDPSKAGRPGGRGGGLIFRPSQEEGQLVNPGPAPSLVRPGQLVSGGPSASASISPSNPETEEDKAKKLLYCSLCKVAVNSLSQLEAHNKGTKHKTILEARSGLGPIKAYPRLGPKPSGEQGGGPVDPNTQERTFHCEICNVRVNSELQLKQHISSRRHRDGMAGKPNPLLSRHKKHRGADLTSSLTFSKDLTKALGAGLLPNPLAVAAAMAAAASSNPLALRAAAPAPHPHHHLLQGPPLSHAILRPAPGPIRTTHGPILFSPY